MANPVVSPVPAEGVPIGPGEENNVVLNAGGTDAMTTETIKTEIKTEYGVASS